MNAESRESLDSRLSVEKKILKRLDYAGGKFPEQLIRLHLKHRSVPFLVRRQFDRLAFDPKKFLERRGEKLATLLVFAASIRRSPSDLAMVAS